MCDNCMDSDDISPNLYDVLGLLEVKELAKHCYNPLIQRRSLGVWAEEGDFCRAEFHEVDVFRFQNLCETYRNYCWRCIRHVIQEEMNWDFDLLEYGISLNQHQKHLDFLKSIEELPDRWRETFRSLLLSEGHNISWFTKGHDGDLQELFKAIQEKGITTQEFLGINKSLIENLEHTLVWEPFDFLLRVIECGYISSEDLKILCGENFMYELFDHAYFEAMPLHETAVKAGGLLAFLQYRDVLCNLDDDITFGDEEERIEMLLNLNVSIEELTYLSDQFLSEECDEFSSLLCEDLEILEDIKETNTFEMFVKTLEMLDQVNLKIDATNLHKFFGMSRANILNAIDNAETNLNHYRAARWFTEEVNIKDATTLLDTGLLIDEVCVLVKAGMTPEILDAAEARSVSVTALTELVKKEPQFPCGALLLWLDAGFGAESLDEMLEWWRAGFTPDNVASWRELGFNALESIAWLRHTSDPVVASRRKEAGISPIKD